MQAVAQAALFSAQQAALQAQVAAEQAMQILFASKDQMRMRLGAAPDMMSPGAAIDAAAGVGAAVDAYHQVWDVFFWDYKMLFIQCYGHTGSMCMHRSHPMLMLAS